MPSNRYAADAPPGASDFIFVGDHPALDLLNTVVGQGAARGDLLRDTASLRAWVSQAPWELPEAKSSLLAAGSKHDWGLALDEVRDVRELGRQIIAAWRAGSPSRAMLGRLRLWMQQVPYSRDLRNIEGRLTLVWVPQLAGPRSLAGLLAGSIGDLLVSARAESVKSCAGANCSLTFLDCSKGQRRVFCSAALCGNRAKVAAYRARQRDAGGVEPG
jgi:predicted RNA-binding Zn ribbon-like protein